MRIIENAFFVDLHTGDDYLLVNGINGAIDVVHSLEKSIIERWKEEGSIALATNYENELYQKLKDREYIMPLYEEKMRKSKIIDSIKSKQKQGLDSSSVWFVLSYNCNFACPYCYEGKDKPKLLMTREMVDQIFAINRQVKRIGFFGGEPLLPKNKEIIHYIISKASSDVEYSVITNGYYLDDFFDTFTNIKTKNIQVTLDGSENIHNQTRKLLNGEKTYERIVSGIERYVQNGLPVTIRMNISENNIEDCFAEKHRIQETDWGKKVRFELQPLFQTEADPMRNLYSKLFLENESATATSENQILNKLLPISNFLYRGVPLKPVIKACDRDGQARFYDALGNVYNCILAVGTEKKSIGTYYPEISTKSKSFMTRDITTVEKCNNCQYSLFCGGGCPNAIPDAADVFSPNCAAFQRELELIIPLVYKMRYAPHE